jgi:hypothetical protein
VGRGAGKCGLFKPSHAKRRGNWLSRGSWVRVPFGYRYRKLVEKGFFEENEIDTVIVFGGTNDSWSNAPLGTEKYSDFSEDELFNVLPAICYFMAVLKKEHPNTKVVFIGNSDIKGEIIDCMRNASKRNDVDFIELHDIDKLSGHPTVLGMTQICEQVIEKLKDCNFAR